MFGLFSKIKKSNSGQFDLEAQHLFSREEEEEEIQASKEHEDNNPKTRSDGIAKIDQLFDSLLQNYLNLSHNKIYDFVVLIKKNPEYKLDSGQKSGIKKLAITSLVGGASGGGFGYLLYDFVTRLIKKSQLEDRWEHLVVETYAGQSYTCAGLNGHGILDPSEPIVDACEDNEYFNSIAEEACRQLHDDYCSEAMPYYTIPEGFGVAIAACILLCMLSCLLYFLYKLLKSSCQNINYDNYAIDQILSANSLLQLKDIASQNQLIITDNMKRIDVVTNLEHLLADVKFIKNCLKMKTYAHYLFYINNRLIEINGIEIPYEIAELIFLYATADKMITSSEKLEKRKEVIENETEKGKEKETEAKDKPCETSLDLTQYKQSMELKKDMFARFFSRTVEVLSIDSKNHSIAESNILQVFR